jgi:clan AA aspartic protease
MGLLNAIAAQEAIMQAQRKPRVRRIKVDFEIANVGDVEAAAQRNLRSDQVRRVTIRGIVDSGATRFVLPAAVVKQLGLRLSGKTRVRYADGRSAVRNIAQGAFVTLERREATFTAIVEPKRETALIGAIVLEELDLLVDCTHQRLVPRDPRYPIAEIE